MSKKQFKSQASSGKVALGGFGGSAFGSSHSSPLSYIQEPPDYSAINDSNLVVAFKNLSKKDSTTKAKALEDIQAHVSSAGTEVEGGLLEAWVYLFPRLSIDSARRVRQLAHSLNGQICSKCGKRTAKHLPTIAAPWLAGCYDNDRAAAKAAQDSLVLVFPSVEKVAGLKKTFQGPILEYFRDAILHETVQTLSDERTVSSDDAEATYARVIATSLAVVANLLGELAPEDVERQRDLYKSLLEDPMVWSFASHPDGGVRRSKHRLVQVALQKLSTLLFNNSKTVSTAYIYKGLASDQTGSSIDFINTLDTLTASLPAIWTDKYTGKKPASSRLRAFLKHGSFAGTSEFWERLKGLFTKMPDGVLPTGLGESRELLIAARDGVTRKEERFNASSAWPAYFTLLSVIIKQLPAEDHEKLLDSCAMPIFRQYLQPSPETADWAIGGAKPAPLVAQAASVPYMAALLERQWPQLADELIQTAKTSQPQQSKEFQKSQLHVASCGERFAALQREFFALDLPDSHADTLVTNSTRIVTECTELLRTRQGKPFGSAAVVEELLRTCGPHLLEDEDFNSAVANLLRSDLYEDGVYMWSSWEAAQQLVRCLFLASGQLYFEECFKGALTNAMNGMEVHGAFAWTTELFLPRNMPGEALSVAQGWQKLQDFASQWGRPGVNDRERDMIVAMYNSGALTDETCNKIFERLVKSLAEINADTHGDTLELLETLDDRGLQRVISSPRGNELLSNVLRLESHEDDDVAQRAATLSLRLLKVGEQIGTETKFGVVLNNLESVSAASLSMDALFDLLSRLLGTERSVPSAREMLPHLDTWKAALTATLRPPKPSLAITSLLGGAVHLVESKTEEQNPVQADGDSLSQALRIAMYVTRLLSETDMPEKISDLRQEWTVIALLYVTVLVAEDNLSIIGCNALWHPAGGPHAEAAVLDLITEANQVLGKHLSAMKPNVYEADGKTFTDYAEFMQGLGDLYPPFGANKSPMRYYVALANARIISNLYESHGHSATQSSDAEETIKQTRSDGDIVGMVSRLTGMQQPLAGTQTLARMCNELIADLTDTDFSSSETAGNSLEQLVKLNAILKSQDEIVASIAKQRVIFLVKRLIPALPSCASLAITAEVCKALTFLLPGMADMYGEHWSEVLSYIISVWTAPRNVETKPSSSEEEILLENASLRLFGVLQKLASSEEPNDDLVDALKDRKDQIDDALIASLKDENGVSDEAHQPLMLTHELLARQINRLPSKPLQDADELYPLLYSPSRPIQEAAFDLLHKGIPAAQEQISLDAALENKTAQLPDELLSLIIEAPTLDSLVDASFDSNMPLSLQSYLYSWRLIFDHFNGSSYRVKSDYIEQLKEGTYLTGLLNFTFDFLGHTRGKPVDASKFDVQEYVADTEPSPERDVQWLLSHLYYLALTHLPSLVKSFFLDIRSRQTSLAVESWTGKYISPLIVNASLQAVAEWSEKSVKEGPEYEKMAVKVGMRSKEINVNYVVDEQTMAIKVVLPEAYPLASAQVVGVSRVAVKEEKWQSWLRNCQGVITFSNGSITDGLSAWRKNVTGALKGQTECAICYSIIDSQKQLPTKRCSTCKNLFHSSCLYKWFKTSNASTCPLCRNPFNFN